MIKNYKIQKNRKYDLEKIRNLLANFKQLWYSYVIKLDNKDYLTKISFSRLDIVPELKKEYKKETYVLTIYRGELEGFDEFSDDLVIDERLEFNNIREVINYLDKKEYLKKENWLMEDKPKNDN